MIRSTNPSDVMFVMMVFAGLLLGLTGRALHVAWEVNDRPMTQRLRYGCTVLATVVSTSFTGYTLYRFGFHQTLALLADYRHADPIFGWAGTIAMVIHAVTPLLAWVCVARIWRTPAIFAYKSQGGYVLTSDVRTASCSLAVYGKDLHRLERKIPTTR